MGACSVAMLFITKTERCSRHDAGGESLAMGLQRRFADRRDATQAPCLLSARYYRASIHERSCPS